MRGDVESTYASTLSGAQNLDASSAAAVLLGASQNRMNALRQLGVMASQYGQQTREAYTQAVGQGAQYEDRAYEYNQWLPWQMKMNEMMGLRNQGQQMMSEGFDQFMGAGIQGSNQMSQQMWYDRMNPMGQQGQMQPQSQWGGNPAIDQMGQQQVGPAAGMGYNPYYGPTPYAQYGYMPNQNPGMNQNWMGPRFNPQTGQYEF